MYIVKSTYAINVLNKYMDIGSNDSEPFIQAGSSPSPIGRSKNSQQPRKSQQRFRKRLVAVAEDPVAPKPRQTTSPWYVSSPREYRNRFVPLLLFYSILK